MSDDLKNTHNDPQSHDAAAVADQREAWLHQQMRMSDHIGLIKQETEYLLATVLDPALIGQLVFLFNQLNAFADKLLQVIFETDINELVSKEDFIYLMQKCQLKLTYLLQGGYQLRRKQRKKMMSMIQMLHTVRLEWEILF